MNLPEINKSIKNLLQGLDYKELPNYPNIVGIVNESTITFIVASGTYDNESNYMELELRLSIACDKRTTDEQSIEQLDNLEELIGFIIRKFHKRPIKNCKPILNKSFEITTPESGKWKAFILFRIYTELDSEYEDSLETGLPVETITRDYI